MVTLKCDMCGKTLDPNGARHKVTIQIPAKNCFKDYGKCAVDYEADVCWLCAKKLEKMLSGKDVTLKNAHKKLEQKMYDELL